jgi:hypothetical protein
MLITLESLLRDMLPGLIVSAVYIAATLPLAYRMSLRRAKEERDNGARIRG